MTLSEAIWNSGANFDHVVESTHCSAICRSSRLTSPGGSGSLRCATMLAASRRCTSALSTSSSSAMVSLERMASSTVGPGNIHSIFAAWIVPYRYDVRPSLLMRQRKPWSLALARPSRNIDDVSDCAAGGQAALAVPSSVAWARAAGSAATAAASGAPARTRRSR